MTSFRNRSSAVMKLVFLHSVLIALEGMVVIISLLTEPSQGGGFLGCFCALSKVIYNGELGVLNPSRR